MPHSVPTFILALGAFLFILTAPGCSPMGSAVQKQDTAQDTAYAPLSTLTLKAELPGGVIDQVQRLSRECIARKALLVDKKAEAADNASKSKQAASIVTGLSSTVGGVLAGVLNLGDGQDNASTYAGFATAGIGAGFSLYSLFSTPGSEQLQIWERRIEKVESIETKATRFIQNHPAPWTNGVHAEWAALYGRAEGICTNERSA